MVSTPASRAGQPVVICPNYKARLAPRRKKPQTIFITIRIFNKIKFREGRNPPNSKTGMPTFLYGETSSKTFLFCFGDGISKLVFLTFLFGFGLDKRTSLRLAGVHRNARWAQRGNQGGETSRMRPTDCVDESGRRGGDIQERATPKDWAKDGNLPSMTDLSLFFNSLAERPGRETVDRMRPLFQSVSYTLRFCMSSGN